MEDGTELLAPKARRAGLKVRELGDEVLVYDLERDQAHCLNRAAGLVWKHCDGRTTVADIALLLERELGAAACVDLAWDALVRLGKDHLLEEQVSRRVTTRGLTRRRMLLKAGVGAAVAVPLISSIAVPTAAYAFGSCGGACNSASDCVVAGCNVCRKGLTTCTGGTMGCSCHTS